MDGSVQAESLLGLASTAQGMRIISLQNLDDERVFPWRMGGVGHREV